MSRVTVVGSGASGVHFALTLLEKGRDVELIDVGNASPSVALPSASLMELKETLDSPVEYFLGAGLESAVLPENGEDIYGFPPGKQYIFDRPTGFEVATDGFDPVYSFARGGLAEAWTAGCYPFSSGEIEDFPFAYEELASGYDEVAGRIGISGALDDLARFYPEHAHLQPPHALDEHSSRLADRYDRRREWLNKELGCYVGRTRVAALSRSLDDRPACANLGRCLWGCPNRAFYTPALTLDACRRYPNFTYTPDVRVLRFISAEGRISAIEGKGEDGALVRLPVEHLVLAAGALSSAEIYLRSSAAQPESSAAPRSLIGLMDNRQVLVPFVHTGMIGRAYEPRSYQYHLLGMGLESEDPKQYVHCQITTLKTALLHPVIQKLPLSLACSTRMIALIHAALGVVNVNFADDRRAENRVLWTPEIGDAGGLSIRYRPADDEDERIGRALSRVRRALRALGCVVPKAMTHVRSMGTSVHYAGLLPMSTDDRSDTTTPTGRSREFENLHFVDGITFPFLPAKNLTFTLMANAVRIARADF